MICPRGYLQPKLDELLAIKAQLENKRYVNEAIIVGWQIDVYREVLKICVDGLYIQDVDIEQLEGHLGDAYNFTYERGRFATVQLLLTFIKIP